MKKFFFLAFCAAIITISAWPDDFSRFCSDTEPAQGVCPWPAASQDTQNRSQGYQPPPTPINQGFGHNFTQTYTQPATDHLRIQQTMQMASPVMNPPVSMREFETQRAATVAVNQFSSQPVKTPAFNTARVGNVPSAGELRAAAGKIKNSTKDNFLEQ